jgi:cysteine desulfurase/selenocysteine lyase
VSAGTRPFGEGAGPARAHSLADRVRADFPLLAETIDDRPVVYLDAASTTPKPRVVIDAVRDYYEHYTANVHRSLHPFGEKSTEKFEAARYEVAAFLGASPAEIVFTRNATEALNLVAFSMGLASGDEGVLPSSEHHSNFLPWREHATPVLLDCDEDGVPLYETLGAKLTARTKLATVAHVSNVTGTIAPIAAWIETAHARGVPVMIDASQSASHLPIDVRKLDVDFLAFSGHKLLGPSGVGVLYAKRERLKNFKAFLTGGGMVSHHGEESFTLRDDPWRFEAGTPAIEATIGLGAAIAYLKRIGMDAVRDHSLETGRRLNAMLSAIPGAKVLGGTTAPRIGLATFTLPVPAIAADGIARLLADSYSICCSGGFHCAHILHDRLKLAGTVRVSGHVFTNDADLAALESALREIV